MSAAPLALTPTAPDDLGAVYDVLADTMALVATYSDTATRFALIRDAKGAAYTVRSASACLLSAASLMDELRPAPSKGGCAA